jgi:hypothetical protein
MDTAKWFPFDDTLVWSYCLLKTHWWPIHGESTQGTSDTCLIVHDGFLGLEGLSDKYVLFNF